MDEEQVERLARSIGASGIIRTHISWVLLAGGYAYKIKKPVRFSFLDFSTIELRERFCAEELRLNRRLSGGIYLDVVPIKDGPAGPMIGGSGDTIDHALRMKRLDNSRMMDRLLAEGKVDAGVIRKIAGMIADFHAGVERFHQGHGMPDMVYSQIDDLRNHKGAIKDACGMEKEVDPLLDSCRQFIGRNRALMESRARDGFVRDCHGDLHSGNIFIMEEPVIIDCIEFSRDFRCIDVASEIAFMSMDLEYHGREDLSEIFVSEYLSKTHDPALETLLPLYKCYRANVRAKIAAIDFSFSKSDDARERIRRYLGLATRYSGLL